MNNRNDDLKKLRIEHETQFINIDFVEMLAKKVTQDLVGWANSSIFKPLGGELSLNIPASGGPNAKAITYWSDPYKPVIEIELSMFIEIYRDAFTFPSISRRIETETKDISNFHDSWICPFDDRYMFSTGVPKIPAASTKGALRPHYLITLETYRKQPNEKVDENDIACRFVMFELVVAWVFFHELGHLVQRHYMLQGGGEGSVEVAIVEIEKTKGKSLPNVPGQAREVMADIEGLDLTLKYMKRQGTLQRESLYLLMCGVNCMYQRFYQRYDSNLDLCLGKHPHPVVRNDFFENFILHWMIEYLGEDKSKVAGPLIYISTRASFFSGLFRAHRVEVFDGEALPTYMALQSEGHEEQKNTYMATIKNELMKTISIVKNTHMMPSNSIQILEKIMDEGTS